MAIEKSVARRSSTLLPRWFVRIAVPRRLPEIDVRDIPTIRMPRIELECYER